MPPNTSWIPSFPVHVPELEQCVELEGESQQARGDGTAVYQRFAIPDTIVQFVTADQGTLTAIFSAYSRNQFWQGDQVMVRFSILMPVYNREKYVRQAVDSVLAQTFTDYEMFAIDDGSTDGSAELLKSYGSRIKFIQQRNQGPEVARNKAAASAQGEYLLLLDSDDFFFPHAFATYDRVIRAFDSPPLVLGAEIYYRDGQIVPPKAIVPSPVEVIKLKDYLSKRVSLTSQCSQLVIRKSAFDKVGGMRDSTPQNWHNDDMNLLLRLGTESPCIVIRKPSSFAYRLHSENSVKNVKAIADGLIELARLERQGHYPGGRERRSERYAIIGGRASTWALRYCWRGGQKKLALRLLLKTAPMIFAALWNKALRYFSKPAAPVVLPE